MAESPKYNGPSLALVGMPGSGKSTIAQLLAAVLGYSWIDTDALTEQQQGASVREMFAVFGERKFRNLEIETWKRVSANPRTVFSTGGGLVLHREFWPIAPYTIWLDPSLDLLEERLKNDESRPLLRVNLRDQLEQMYEARKYEYGRADLRVAVYDHAPSEVVNEIQSQLWNL